VGTQAQAAPDFVPKILASKGAPDWYDGAQTATDLASTHADISAQVQKMSSGLESVWTGSGSEAAQAKIKPLGDVANAASQTFTANAQNLTGLAHGFEAMKQSLTPMPPTPPHKNFGDVISPWATDTEKQINQYNQDAQQNIARYRAYSQQAQAAGQGLKTDYGQIGGFGGGDITLAKPPTPPSSKKITSTSTSDNTHSVTNRPTAQTRDPGSTQWTPPPGPPSQQHIPVGRTETPQGPGTPQTDGTHSAGYTPPPTSTSGFTPPPIGSSSAAGGSSSWAGGLGSLMGGTFSPGGSGGADSGGSSSIGSRLTGAGNSSGAGATGEGTTGRASAGSGSSSGTAGSRGASGMGGAGGHKGTGAEDAEHQRKYGLDDDSAFSLVDEVGERLVDPNTGLPVTPPTLGG
jgi:hypothetical protein